MLVLALFFVIAHSAPSFPNSTTSRSTATTTSALATITAGPFPTELCSNQNFYCSRSGAPYFERWAAPYINPYWYYPGFTGTIAETLEFYCYTIWSNELQQWLATAPVTTARTVVPASTIVEFDATTRETLYPGAYVPVYYKSTWSFTASPPCCSSCSIDGATVQVYFWPTVTTAAPSAGKYNKTNTTSSTLVNSKGFHFVSPSIYVAFSSLSARNLCGTLGPIINATTLSFAPGDLLTMTGVRYNTSKYYSGPIFPNSAQVATWGTQAACDDVTTSFWQDPNALRDGITQIFSDYNAVSEYFATATCNSSTVNCAAFLGWSTSFTQYTVTYNLCSPYLFVPTQIRMLETAWTGCTGEMTAWFDPPYTLTSGNGLSPFSTTAASDPTADPDITTNAQAGSSPTPSTATKTADPLPALTSAMTADPPSNPSSVDPATKTQQSSSSPAPSPSPADLATSGVAPNIFTLGSSTLTANSGSAFVIASQTLLPGSSITASETTYALASNGGTLAIAGSSGTSTQILTPAPTPTPPAYYVIGSQTLSAGGPVITLSSSIYSLQAGGESVVVNGETQGVAELIAAAATVEYVFGSQTLVIGGPAVTISGTVVSLGANGVIVISGQSMASSTLSRGLGGVIVTIGGFRGNGRGSGTATTTYLQVGKGWPGSNITYFIGSGERSREIGGLWVWGAVLGIGIFGVMGL